MRTISIDSRGRALARRDRLTLEHLHLVEPIVRRMLRDVPARFEKGDLVSLGRMGLMQAALRYRPRAFGGTPFPVYARRRIRGAILDGLRRRNWIEAHHASVETLQRIREGQEAAAEAGGVRYLSGSGLMAGFEEATTEVPLEAIDARRVLRRMMAGRIRRLTPVQAAVLRLYYSADEPTLSQVAKRLGLPVAMVARERAAGLRALRIELGA